MTTQHPFQMLCEVGLKLPMWLSPALKEIWEFHWCLQHAIMKHTVTHISTIRFLFIMRLSLGLAFPETICCKMCQSIAGISPWQPLTSHHSHPCATVSLRHWGPTNREVSALGSYQRVTRQAFSTIMTPGHQESLRFFSTFVSLNNN